jgi:hypothetical protein
MERFEFADFELKLFDALNQGDNRVLLRVRKIFEALRFAGNRIGPSDRPRRNSYGSRVCRDVSGHDRSASDFGLFSDCDRAKDFRAYSNDHAVPERWMSLAFLFSSAAESHALVQRHIVADDCGFADHDAHAMIDENALADRCSRMNFDPCQESGKVGNQPTEQRKISSIEPMGNAMKCDGMQARLGKHHF